MLKTSLVHPQILEALAGAGHGARVLIADGNFPLSTESAPAARKVYLNLRPGLVNVSDVLQTLTTAITIESALLMEPADGQPVPLHDSLRKILPADTAISTRKRLDFYAEAKSPATALVIATGEERRFANIILTIGVVAPATT